MKKLAIIAALVASTVYAAEVLRGTLSGAGTQRIVVGKGAKLALQCTTDVRYLVSGGASSPDAGASDTIVAQGDPYRIDMPAWADTLNVSHRDNVTAISCAVFTRDP